MRERAHLGDEGEPPAPDLADGAAAHQHALARVACQFTRQTSTAALSQRPSRMSVSVMRSERQHALGVLGVDREVGARADLGGGEPALGLEVGAVEAEHPVVVGEAEGHAVGTGDPPAPGERRGALVEMRLQAGGRWSSSRSSTSGMEVIEPSRSMSSVTSSRSVSKRTGTSNSKPAVIATPAPGRRRR